MSATPSSKSLLRLVLGAAFVLVAWFLASSTSAQADDRVSLGSVVEELGSTLDETLAPDKTTAPLRTVVEDATSTVKTAVETATTTVDRVVDAAPVAPAVKAPVKKATATVRTLTTSATTEVVAPTVDLVVDVVDDVTGAAGSLPVPGVELPPVDGPLVPGLDPGTGGPDPIVALTDGSVSAPTPVAAVDSTVRDATVATGSGAAPVSDRSTVTATTRAPAELPSDPGPVFPTLDLSGLGALAPSAGAGSASALLLAALGLAFILLRPELLSFAPRVSVVRPAPGPAADPGSRPD